MDSAIVFMRVCSSSSSSCGLSHSLSGSSNPNIMQPPLKSPLPMSRKSLFKLMSFARSPRRFSNSPVSPVKMRVRSPSFSSAAVTTAPSLSAESPSVRRQRLAAEFQSLKEPIDRVKRLLHYATLLAELDDAARVDANRVMGCTAQVWLDVRMSDEGRMWFSADSDSEITRGFCSCLVWLLDGAAPEEVLAMRTEDLAALNVGVAGRVQSRVNTWYNVLISMQKRTKALVAQREGSAPFDPFPSLIVTANGMQAKGSYAEAQAKFLIPDEVKVKELVDLLRVKKIGVAAHFYMDPEVQGVLTAAQKEWPHIHISDSLIMADMAVKMAEAGCKFVAVLGVDFMSENVRAILDQAGFEEVGVYRMSNERIGCSLAAAAATPAYMNYLEAASLSPPSLHVVYINTSLETKAHAHEVVPTITCTSSNVVQTILQAFAQVPNLNVWYGPDSYMGANIKELFQLMAKMTDEEIAEIHPEHNKDSIRSLLPRLCFYQDGSCIVHQLFGHEVVEKIKELYCDAFLTAHLEVPGEMFSLAMEARDRGMGVVGSTQNILDFIKQRVEEALDRNVNDHLQFVLGTESGMVTSIVAAVRRLLRSPRRGNVVVEIVFPVSSDSVTSSSRGGNGVEAEEFVGMPLVMPGVAGGEGCSIHGGCASCPFMKVNSLGSLLEVCRLMPDNKSVLPAYEAARFGVRTRSGKLIADVGCEPILHMRQFQATKKLPDQLVLQILSPDTNGK